MSNINIALNLRNPQIATIKGQPWLIKKVILDIQGDIVHSAIPTNGDMAVEFGIKGIRLEGTPIERSRLV